MGLTLAARLLRGGVAVRLVVRREEARTALAQGLVAEDASSAETFRVAPAVQTGLERLEGPILVCTRRGDVSALADQLATKAGNALVVTFQNDVESEVAAARHLPRVAGGVWRETCTRIADDRVRFLPSRAARAVVGLHPGGSDPAVDTLAALLRRGDIDVGISDCIADDKWLKLCVNLCSASNALVRREDHATEAFVEGKALLLEEARSVLSAAGIRAASCDGRDRSIDDEILFHRASLAQGSSARPIPLYNEVWSSLSAGTEPEAIGYHERILSLGAEAGLALPTHERALAALRHAVRTGSGPERLAAADLLPPPRR